MFDFWDESASNFVGSKFGSASIRRENKIRRLYIGISIFIKMELICEKYFLIFRPGNTGVPNYIKKRGNIRGNGEQKGGQFKPYRV